jgi:hypothetical protein
MQSGAIISVLIFCLIVTAGCIQLPGMHILTNTPDSIIGHWIGGEPPASDLHMVFFENRTFFSTSFYLSQGEKTDRGTWMKKGSGLYSTQSVSENITSWVYDPTDDSLYLIGLPQQKYYRHKG